MFRTAASRAFLTSSAAAARSIPSIGARRTLFSSAAAKKRGPGPKSFKGALARWGLAVGGTYYYMTSSVFAEETTYFKQGTRDHPTYPAAAVPPAEDDEDPTLPRSHRDLDDLRYRSRTTGAVSHPEDSKLITASEAGTTHRPGSREELATDVSDDASASHAVDTAVSGARSPEQLEEEADQQGAFNPETGEINWDCPCLGGMAHGPCGEEFKTAFSCFVHSTAEPKGVDCIENFKGMQDCFRKYPDVYGSEIDDDAEGEEEEEEDELAPGPTEESTLSNKLSSHPEPAVEDATRIPARPGSKEEMSTEEVKEKVKREVPPATEER